MGTNPLNPALDHSSAIVILEQQNFLLKTDLKQEGCKWGKDLLEPLLN